jgi:hypothetical protein
MVHMLEFIQQIDKKFFGYISVFFGVAALLSLMGEPLICGLPMALIGIVSGYVGKRSAQGMMSTAGMILCVIVFVVSIVVQIAKK